MHQRQATLVGLIAVVLLLAGCVASLPDGSAPGATSGPDRVVIWQPGVASTVVNWDTDPIVAAVEAATNTDIQIVNIDSASFADQVNAAAASGELPDIIGIIPPAQQGLMESFARDGILAAFEGEIAAAAPNVLAQYASNPMLQEILIDGTIYYQPIGWGDGIYPNQELIHVRKDLLDKYGLEPPDTFEEFFAYVKTCMDAGDARGVVFQGAGGLQQNINPFVGAYGVPVRGWVEVEDGYEFWAIQPGTLQGLLLFREMFERGLVDPAVWEMADATNDARNVYVAGEACALLFNGGGHIGRIQNDMALVNESLKEWLLPAPDAGAGSRGYTAEEMFWGTSQIGAMAGNNPVAAARVIDYLISDEGYQLTAIGIEDVHWEYQDNEIVLLDKRFDDGFPRAAGGTGAHELATRIVSWVPQEWQNWQLLYGQNEEYKAWFEEMWANQGLYQIPSYGTLITTPAWIDFQATSNDLVNRRFLDIVRAETPELAESLFDEFVQAWLAAGGEAAQNEMSAKLLEVYQ